MRERNLDFEIPLTREQWDQAGRRAQALGPEDAGLEWSERDAERIHVYLRDEDTPPLWRDHVSDDDRYGASRREIAQFVFNGGRPYAHLEAPAVADEPTITDQVERAMEVEAEQWVRGRWHTLMRESGLHYDRGHLPEDVDRTP